MHIPPLNLAQLTTERLLLIPFTTKICKNLLNNDFSDILEMGLQKGKCWPDHDVMDTLPRILNNLSQIHSPTGFESWMVIKKDTLEIIGDVGFKGFNEDAKSVNLGYGIILEERKKGFAEEAAKGLIKWAFSNDFVQQITANCLINNFGSIKLLKKLNFVELVDDMEMLHWKLAREIQKNYN